MDSINRNQPEENHRDLHRAEAVDKLREIIDKSHTCFFCTGTSGSETAGTERAGKSTHDARPMSVRKIDEFGNLWFLSAADSHKNRDIESDPGVKLYFQGSPHSDFMELNGRASITAQREVIEELWEPILKTWFTEGIDDPRITAIRVVPSDGYYWDNKHGNFVAGVKMLIGAAIGQTMDDGVEGRLTP